MSNRALAIVGALAFMALFFVQTDAIRQAAGRPQSCPSLNAPNPPSLNRLEAYALLIANELAFRNQLEVAALSKAHPDLAPELRYKEFVDAVAQAKIGANLLKMRPLREQYKDDFEQLKARYVSEHPDTKFPE